MVTVRLTGASRDSVVVIVVLVLVLVVVGVSRRCSCSRSSGGLGDTGRAVP